MNRISPKIEIINHFDALINKVDIDFEECIKKYNEQQILGDLECFDMKKRKIVFRYSLYESKKQTVDLWSESTKVLDYLKQVRMRTIEELRKAQDKFLDYYKLNSYRFKSLEIEELRSQLFAEKFYFQVQYTPRNAKPWVFNIFTFVTDFYMSPNEINILE